MSDRTKRISIECVDEGIVALHLADAEEKNAFSTSFTNELLAALETISNDRDSRVCIVRGLPEVFCSGGHRDMLLDLAHGKIAASDIMISRAMLEVPIPTIAAMEGHAVGGGLALGLCCDVMVMARESRYGCSFMNMGFTPGMGTTRLLQMAVGEFVAAEMMYGGEFFRGTHFQGRGVNHVLPRSQVLSKSISIARRFADKPRHALELLKRSLSLVKRQAFEDARTTESMMHEICFSQPETAKAIEDFLGDA